MNNALLRFGVTCGVALAGLLPVHTAHSAPTKNLVTPLPAVTAAASWQVRPGDDEMLRVDQAANGLLHLRVTGGKEREGRLLLRAPIAMPEEMTDATFRLVSTGSGEAKLRLDLVIRDATGRDYLFFTSSPVSYDKGIFKPYEPARKNRSLRYTVPGLTRMDVSAGRQATVISPDGKSVPQRPYTLVGLNIWSNANTAVSDLYLAEACLTRLAPNASPLYYQFNDQVYFGELDPVPAISLGELSAGGRVGTYRADWEIYDRYDGQPLRTGSTRWTLTNATDRLPLPLQCAERMPIPVTDAGTYWVRLRVLRESETGGEWSMREYRLYVMRGQPARVTTPATAVSCLEVAPQRESLIFTAQEPCRVPVTFRRPAPDAGQPYTGEITVLTAGMRTEVKRIAVQPTWSPDGLYRTTVDLTSLPAGAYRVRVSLSSGPRLLDQIERLLGKQDGNPRAQQTAAIPATVPSYQALLSGERPLFHLGPMVKSHQLEGTLGRWDYLKPFLEQASTVSRDIEYLVPWRLIEPLPGVYDWEEVDHVLDYAQAKGLFVVIWPSITDVPEWMPSYFKQNSDGSIFAKTNYLFHGGRPNFFTAPVVRQAVMRLWQRLALRYRTHPALQGYYVLLEHPGEAPYNGWTDGYEPETVAAFRDAGKAQWGTLAQVNARWGTSYAAWENIAPPTQAASARYWLDWLQFRVGTIDALLLDQINTIRQYDAKRVILVYGDFPQNYAGKLRLPPGCLLTNGGSHDAINASMYASTSVQGYQERTEDHSPGEWSGYFPYQLDASLFAMSTAGGASMHCKAFEYTRVPGSKADVPFTFDGLRKSPYALDRFEKFQPIWSELRTTTVAAERVFVYRDLDSYLLDYRTTYMGYVLDRIATQTYCENQLSFAAAGPELWHKSKLLLLTERTVTNLHRETMEQLQRYVEQGGVLVMRANAGRRCIERPADDWALLTRFGFAAPAGEAEANRRGKAVPVTGALFSQDAQPFTLQNIFTMTPPKDARTEAFFDGDRQRAALSWKAVGKGRVVVLWAANLCPPSQGEAEPVLRDLARWSGVALPLRASNPRLWMNLLRRERDGVYYGLAHRPTLYAGQTPEVGAACWRLPQGAYVVTELISGKSLGLMQATEIEEKGIAQSLHAGEVTIYRFQPSK